MDISPFGHTLVEHQRPVSDTADSPLASGRGTRDQVQIDLGVNYSFDMKGLW